MYVLSYRGPKFTEVAAFKVASDEEAEAYKATLSNDGTYCVVVIKDANSLSVCSWSLAGILYNALSDVPIKKFDNAEVARGRLFAVIERVAKSFDAASATPAPPVEEGETADNGSAPAEESSSSDNNAEQEDNLAAKKKAKKKAPKEKSERKPRKGSIPKDGKITVLFDKNPRREGSALWKMYENLRNGMLVSTYLEKGGSLGSLVKGVKKKWISVE